MPLKIVALGFVALWVLMVLLGFLGKRWGAAGTAVLTVALVTTPFLPRFMSYMRSPDAFFATHGNAAMNEILISGLCVALGLLALLATPLVVRRSWGWMVPAVLTLPPVVLIVWLTFYFRLF